MSNAYFIDQDYLIRYSWINGTTDEKYLRPAIRLAQLKRVRFYLGKCLYDKMESLVTNQLEVDNTSINHVDNAKYKTLLDDYLQDVTMYWALVELYPYLVRKIDNSNIIKRVGQNTETLSSDELADMVKTERSNAQHFTDQMIRYLCDLDGTYTIDEWETCDNELAGSPKKELDYLPIDVI
jgi:hypothetical protein